MDDYEAKREFYAAALIGRWKAQQTFSPEKKVPYSAWEATCIRREFIDRLRADKPGARYQNSPEMESMKCLMLQPDPKPSPLDLAILSDIRARVRNAVDDLPPSQRAVIQGIFFKEMERKEIAQIRSVTESAIYRSLEKAIPALRVALAELEMEMV